MAKNLKLGEILKQAGIIDDFQLHSALSYQRHWGGRFGESLIRLGYLSEDKLQDFLARQFDLPQIDLLDRKITDDVLAYIPAEKARELHVLPVERKSVSGTIYLVVAMTDPTNLMVTDSLQFITGCRIKAALASAEAITSAIDMNYGVEMNDQVELDFALEELASQVPKPTTKLSVKPPAKPVAPPAPRTAPSETRSAAQAVATAVAPQASVVQNNGPSASAFKKLENRYENLVRILLDRGIIDFKDLDELM